MGNLMPHDYQKTVSPEGYESYAAFRVLYPVDINVRRFSTLDKPWPKDMFFAKVADSVKETSRKNAEAHFAVPGWRGVNALDGKAKGKTMVICGSGRSILKTAPKIPRDRDDLIVVAINGALKAMPPGSVDIYFTLDWLSNPDWWRGIDMETTHPGIVGVLGLAAPGELATVFKERFYFPANWMLADPEKAEEFVRHHGFLAECELATHSAMHLAYRMGCSRVILLGHDFACTAGEGGYYYHHDEVVTKAHSLNQEFKAILDMNDRMTVSTDNMIKNSNIVNATMQMMAEDGVECWNCSDDGILCPPNTAPLDQVLAREESLCPS